LQGLKPAYAESIESLKRELKDSKDIIKTLQIDLDEKEELLKELKRKYNNAKNIIKDQAKKIESLEGGTNNNNNDVDKIRIKELEKCLSLTKNSYDDLLQLKDKIISELKDSIQRNDLKKIGEIIQNDQNVKKNNYSLNFVSSNVYYSIICSDNDTFAEAEEILYKKYDEFRDTNNIFLYQGTPIKRFRTIKENKIDSGMPITMIIPENENNDQNNNQSENNGNNAINNQNNPVAGTNVQQKIKKDDKIKIKK